ncbi:Nitrile-specifier protein 5 [Escovopsis weberi]|uniref:Nitrile-specifier protein 5 n=1 Tax=Escovopsis weberi TaxID=150374 RepID=A0A0M9VVW6_ESCWE|nr:Nitrile-specifier protein 5 [Escovopsis weberi]
MEQLNGLWRSMPSFRKPPAPTSTGGMTGMTGMTGTWERIHLPPIPRSSHSVNVLSGCAYIFGGETSHDQAVDNDMHVIRLPFSSAGADYFKIPAKADPSAVTPGQETPQGGSPRDSLVSSPGGKHLDQMSLGSLEASETAETASEDGDDAKSDTTTKSETKSVKSIKSIKSIHSTRSFRNFSSGSNSRSGSRTRFRSKGKGRALDVRPILPDVPPPRVGHATATIGARIFMFGGRGGPDMKPLDEGGRVWIFDTRTRAWSFLDPVPAVKGGAIIPHPAPRSCHAATATDRPRDFPPAPRKKADTWSEWALGDTTKTGIPQDPVVGHVAEDAVDEESNGYGTFFVHAGRLESGDRTSDLWAFDVRSRTWTGFPAAPSPAREGPSICISKGRIYRFGGFDGQRELGGQLDFLPIGVEMHDDGASRGEVSLRAGGSWQTIHEDVQDVSTTPTPALTATPTSPESTSELIRSWPEPRSAASLQAVTVGGATEYLILTMGEQSPAHADEHEGARFFSDVWVYQVPQPVTTGFTSAVYQAMARRRGDGRWTRVLMTPYDDEVFEMPRARGLLASAPMTDLVDAGILIWGGLDENNRQRGEGWILRLGSRDTPNGNS